MFEISYRDRWKANVTWERDKTFINGVSYRDRWKATSPENAVETFISGVFFPLPLYYGSDVWESSRMKWCWTYGDVGRWKGDGTL